MNQFPKSHDPAVSICAGSQRPLGQLVASDIALPAALARSNGPVKRRWLQFSLRGLLGVAALVCLLLGGWHLFVTYGNWVDAENPRVGAPIRVKGRGILPDDCEMVLGYYRADEPGCVEKHFRGEKSWLGLYSAEYELDPVDRPCQIVVYLGFYDGSDSWIGKEKTVDVK